MVPNYFIEQLEINLMYKILNYYIPIIRSYYDYSFKYYNILSIFFIYLLPINLTIHLIILIVKIIVLYVSW